MIAALLSVEQMILVFPLLGALVLPALAVYVPPGPRFRCPREVKYIYPCVCLRGSDRGLYIHCENTNLASLSLAFSNLGNEGMPIEELVLYKCNIGTFLERLSTLIDSFHGS